MMILVLPNSVRTTDMTRNAITHFHHFHPHKTLVVDIIIGSNLHPLLLKITHTIPIAHLHCLYLKVLAAVVLCERGTITGLARNVATSLTSPACPANLCSLPM
jgi:hypothetical protein